MFRNGLAAATRRPLARSLSNIAIPPLASQQRPFVCISCQSRGFAANAKPRARRSRPPKPRPTAEPEISAEAVKRLEVHVQLLQKNYSAMLKKEAATKELPDREITDADRDAAYAALMAPPTTAVFLPEPKQIADRLPEPIVRRLGEGGLALAKTEEQLEWETVLNQLDSNGGFEGMERGDVVKLMACMDVPQRATTFAQVLDMMERAKLKPHTFIYDLAMSAHAGMGHSVEVKALFAELKNKNLAPTVYSYAHLLKAYSQELDAVSSRRALQEMHAIGIEPNLVIYTTLIQTHINLDELETAWQIFNLIKYKSTATAPDEFTYTLMIHACAKKGEAERALDLYTDMTERRNLVPNEKTYHALIHACAVRADYFHQAWKFATNMQREGMQIERSTLNVLVQACGRTGELTRARLLVRHMMASNREDMIPDRFTYQNLLRAYALYNAAAKKTPQNAVKADQSTFVSPNSKLMKQEGSHAKEIPFFAKGVLNSFREVLDESAILVNWLRDTYPGMVDTQMMNSYLDICRRQRGFYDLVWCYKNDFENPPGSLAPEPDPRSPPSSPYSDTSSPDTSTSTSTSTSTTSDTSDTSSSSSSSATDSPPIGTPGNPEIMQPPQPESKKSNSKLQRDPSIPRLPRNIYTYKTALLAANNMRNIQFARQVWADRLAYTQSPSYWRLRAKLRAALDFEAEKLMIDVLARTGHVAEAAKRVVVLSDEVEWKWADLRTLYARAVQLEDPDTAALVKKVTGFDERRERAEREAAWWDDV